MTWQLLRCTGLSIEGPPIADLSFAGAEIKIAMKGSSYAQYKERFIHKQ